MSTSDRHQEVEIKVEVPDKTELEGRLRSLGFEITKPRVLEQNVIYDLADGSLRKRGELIRLRRAGSHSTLTYKGAAVVNRHKEREEVETGIENYSMAHTILLRLGYVPGFRYEKFRTEWNIPGEEGTIMVDETPVGIYMELEGPSSWIDRRAADLGYQPGDYINLSYARIYQRECERNGVTPSDMIFGQGSVPGTCEY